MRGEKAALSQNIVAHGQMASPKSWGMQEGKATRQQDTARPTGCNQRRSQRAALKLQRGVPPRPTRSMGWMFPVPLRLRVFASSR
jgi:hypothetical protein